MSPAVGSVAYERQSRFDIEVRGVRHLADVVAALRSTTAVNRVERSRH